ncbi:hypothetical protein CERZMDRAFT_94953 [Cercospora zeae-maydis SCOH1-5]|uniref:Uncharacterized protein n=1 Tax=Cercospora zeae-maydis SCOH1-5 TaxID=717836 RepID=A0A6A6FM87_9PEZI|nr:hypothetical protein CERZMDRAFT_94953 [Cercospora zeae-maydis SCOH1-5]
MPAWPTVKGSGGNASQIPALKSTRPNHDEHEEEKARQAAPSPSLNHHPRSTQEQRRRRSAQYREYQHEGQPGAEKEKVCCGVLEGPVSPWVPSSISSQRRRDTHRTRCGAASLDRTRAHRRDNGSDEDAFQHDIRYFAHSRHPTRFTSRKYSNEDPAEGATHISKQSGSLARGHIFSGEKCSQSIPRRQLSLPTQHEIKCDKYSIQDQERASSCEIEIETQLDGGAEPSSSEARDQARCARSRTVNVADRVKALETKAINPVPATFTRQDGKARADMISERNGIAQPVPFVFPLHVRRFTRRTSNGRFLRPQTPLYQSCLDNDAEIHAPLPQRTIPIVRSPVERSTGPADPLIDDDSEGVYDRTSTQATTMAQTLPGNDTTTNIVDHIKIPPAQPQYQINSQVWPEQASFRTVATRVDPVSHLHGRRNSCFRHGRKQTTFKGTRDLYDQGGRGQYVPAGFDEPRNVDATSPYLVHNLTRYSRALDRDDACPDCVAELSIRRRESEPEHLASVATPVAAHVLDERALKENTEQDLAKSTSMSCDSNDAMTAAAIPPEERDSSQGGDDTDSTVLGVPKEPQMPAPEEDARNRNARFAQHVHESSTPNEHATAAESNAYDRSEDDDKIVLTSDLGDGLDAVILERGGRLERVVMNLRKNAPTVAGLLRLSRELIQVADALEAAASKGAESTDGAHSSPDEPAIYSDLTSRADLDTLLPRIFDSVITRERTDPSTVAECDFARCQDAASQALYKHFPRRASTKAPLPSPGTRLVNRQRIQADYRALRKHFGRGSSYDEPEFAELGAEDRLQMRAARNLQTTPLGHEAHSNLLNMASTSSSPDVLYCNRASVDVPNISVTDNASYEHGPISLPSHILKARDIMYPPLPWSTAETRSPPLFSQSTCPSLNTSATNSTEHSPTRGIDATFSDHSRVYTWKELTDATAPSPDTARTQEISSLPQVLYSGGENMRQADRMDKNQAVHEAAALERRTRRRRYTKSQVRTLNE